MSWTTNVRVGSREARQEDMGRDDGGDAVEDGDGRQSPPEGAVPHEGTSATRRDAARAVSSSSLLTQAVAILFSRLTPIASASSPGEQTNNRVTA